MRFMSIVLLVCFGGCIFLFSKALHKNNQDNLSYNYEFVLPTLYQGKEPLDTSKLKGKPYIINIFASWCTTCHVEHGFLLEIAKKNIIDIYGVDYLDTEEKAKNYLEENGNPYKIVAVDYRGDISRRMGVLAVPETMIFNSKGEMVLRLSGDINDDTWQNKILPAIK